MSSDTVSISRSYVLGKGTDALRQIGELCDVLKRTDLTAEQLRDEIHSHLSYALYDFTKVLSTVAGADWETEDREKVLHKGVDGVEELLVRYGTMAKESTRAHRLHAGGTRVYELSKLPKAEGRTLMHEELRRIPTGIPAFDGLRDVLEQVTMGTRPWADVQRWCDEHLADYAPRPPAT